VDALRAIGVAATALGGLSALFVLWAMRNRTDVGGRTTRYRMLGIISLCAILPARLFLEQRLSIIPWLLLLFMLLGSGGFFLSKAGSFAGPLEIPTSSSGDASTLVNRGSAATRQTTGLGLTLILITLLLFKWPALQGRMAVTSIGMFVTALALLRPPGFWDAPLVRAGRRLFGDWPVAGLYLCCGILFIVFAWLAEFQ
jgi:hypothetical protein